MIFLAADKKVKTEGPMGRPTRQSCWRYIGEEPDRDPGKERSSSGGSPS